MVVNRSGTREAARGEDWYCIPIYPNESKGVRLL